MKEFYAYHVVTDRPMHIGQHIIFDDRNHNGVWKRVNDKADIVSDIYANPGRYDSGTLEHHTSVALRELALEEIRQEYYPEYPSRMGCLYVSENLEDAEMWFRLFIEWGRPTYQIVRLRIKGNCFIGDANNCFDGRLIKQDNLLLAKRYWENTPNENNERPIREMLVNGDIEVVEIIRDINAGQ